MNNDYKKSNFFHKKVYSTQIFRCYFTLIREKYGQATLDELHSQLSISRDVLENPNRWVNHNFNIEFVEKAKALTKDKNLTFNAGCYWTHKDAVGYIRNLAIGFLNPLALYLFAPKMALKFTKAAKITSEKITNNKVLLKNFVNEGFREEPFICQNRTGFFYSVPFFFGLPAAKVTETKCLHKGDSHCEYIVEFEDYTFLRFKQISFVFLLITLIALLSLITSIWHPINLLMPLIISISSGITSLFSLVLYFYNKTKTIKKNADVQHTALEEAIGIFEKRNKELDLLHQIAVYLNDSLYKKPPLPLNYVLKKISQKIELDILFLVFDSIDEKIAFNFNIYPEEEKEVIKQYFNQPLKEVLLKDELLNELLKQKESLIIDLPPKDTAKSGLSSILNSKNISNLYDIPILDKGQITGVMVGCSKNGVTPTEETKILLGNIASLIGSAVSNRDLLEDLKKKVEKIQMQQDALIQSEKMAVIGRLIAGINHDLRGPINFIYNILPDIRSDVDALEQIRAKYMEYTKSSDRGLLNDIKEIEENSDLVNHLTEKEYVFNTTSDSIQRINTLVNNLRVFSRKTTDEEPKKKLSIKTIINNTVNLIPKKILIEKNVKIMFILKDIIHIKIYFS